MVDRAEVDLDGVHDEGVVEATEDVELSLRIVFIARFKRDRLHGELDLVVVLLLDKLDDAILTGAKAIPHVVQLDNLLGF